MFRRPKFFQGRKIRGSKVKDVMWFNPGGTEMNDDEWETHFVRCLGMMLSGDTMDVRDEQGEPIRDDTFLILFNAHHESMPIVLPGQKDVRWELILATEEESGFLETPEALSAGDEMAMVARSLRLFRLSVGSETHARSDSWKKLARKPAPKPPAKPRKR